ncbi:MAG: hypothetical protein J7L07_11645, partial [Candidatus Odinarchaeota archaeon]|nr:hypothetical protein [Candidatus Odinarchaeota archaeon]
MDVVLFGAYDKNTPRYRILVKGLRKNNVNVIECSDRSKPMPLRFIKLIKKHKNLEYDILLIGHVGQYLVPLAKLVSRKAIVFDIFNSLYETIVIDRKLIERESYKAKML